MSLMPFSRFLLDDDDFFSGRMVAFPQSAESKLGAFSMDLIEKENEFQVHAGKIDRSIVWVYYYYLMTLL